MPKGDNPNSRANLKIITEKTAREMGKKGAIASNKVRAEKKTIRQWLEVMGAMKANPEIASKMQRMFPDIKVEQFTNDAAMAARMYNDAIVKGDARAQSNIADIKGERLLKQEIVARVDASVSSDFINTFLNKFKGEDVKQ